MNQNMIAIHCHTNLDLEIADKCGFPDALPAIPRVGDFIQSKMRWLKNRHPLELEVVRVSWESKDVSTSGVPNFQWTPVIELTVPRGRYPDYRDEVKGTDNWGVCNMYGFYEWYGKLTGKGLHAYL